MAPTLYYTPLSPPCQLVLLVAKHLNLSLNLKELHPRDKDQLTPEFVQANPTRTIPTLVDDEFYLPESRAISIYLLEKFGNDDPLIPKDPKLKALVYQRLFFDESVTWQRAYDLVKPFLYFNKMHTPDLLENLQEGLGFLEKFLDNSKWLAGNYITIADYGTLTTISLIEVLPIKVLDKFPSIMAWLKRAKQAINGYEEIIESTNEERRELYLQKYSSVKTHATS